MGPVDHWLRTMGPRNDGGLSACRRVGSAEMRRVAK